jgi:TonB family protein
VSASLASESDPPLIFTWDEPRRRKLAITGFLTASVILHALCFYAFQIVYPPAVALLPPPGRVTMIAPNTEEGRVLLRWLEAEDPALASITQPAADRKSLAMPTMQHAPSYLMRQPALKEMPPSPPDPAVPSAQPPGPVGPLRAPIQTMPKNAPTLVHVSTELDTIGVIKGPEMKFTASSRESPQAAQFRLAVDESGAVRNCFLEKSSGDAALDEQARKYLALYRFSAIRNSNTEVQHEFVWGTATFAWGNDIVAPVPATGNVAP